MRGRSCTLDVSPVHHRAPDKEQREKELELPISSRCRHIYKRHTKNKEEIKSNPQPPCYEATLRWQRCSTYLAAYFRLNMHCLQFVPCFYFFICQSNPLTFRVKFDLYQAFKLDLFSQSLRASCRLCCGNRLAALATFCCFHLELDEQRTVCSVRRRQCAGKNFKYC